MLQGACEAMNQGQDLAAWCHCLAALVASCGSLCGLRGLGWSGSGHYYVRLPVGSCRIPTVPSTVCLLSLHVWAVVMHCCAAGCRHLQGAVYAKN
jgi:hypothetical protein